MARYKLQTLLLDRSPAVTRRDLLHAQRRDLEESSAAVYCLYRQANIVGDFQ